MKQRSFQGAPQGLSASDFAQLFDHLDLRDGTRELGQRFGLGHFVDLPGECFFGALTCG